MNMIIRMIMIVLKIVIAIVVVIVISDINGEDCGNNNDHYDNGAIMLEMINAENFADIV